MQDNTSYQIRKMSLEELSLALEWAAREGWNPGLRDAVCFHAADPDGFLIGLLEDHPVAAISAVRYSEHFSFLGLYLVQPEYRGQGYGWQIWQKATTLLQGQTIGLDGVVEQQKNYQKSGFQLAYRNIRFGGHSQTGLSANLNPVSLKTIPLTQLVDYDQKHFPAQRANFLHTWMTQPGTESAAIIEAGNLAGYGVIRPCRLGYKIGSLFADRAEVAESLFITLTTRLPENSPIFLDVPEPNSPALLLAEKYGLTCVFETARMYAGRIPETPLSGVFGVTSFELG